MLVTDIKKSTGLNKKAKTVGRGNGSGKGNYSKKGLKGQNARSGGSRPSWFEGGQTPMNLRLPKLRGFKRPEKFKTKYTIINLMALENSEAIKSDVDKAILIEAKLIKKESESVKILGNGELKKSLTFKGIEAFSNTAKQAIEKSGGKIE